MAKKKSRQKKSQAKSRASRLSGMTAKELRGEVLTLLAKNRLREALSSAKALIKLKKTREHDELYVRACNERIADLLRRRLPKEAEELYDNMIGACPDVKNESRWVKGAIHREKTGKWAELLRMLDEDNFPKNQKEQIQRYLSGALDDLDALVSEPEIPENNSLRKQAEALNRTFQQVTSGSEDVDLQVLSSAVPRKSPLLSWRWLIHSIDSVYRQNGAQALKYIERIDPNSKPYELTPVIRYMATKDRTEYKKLTSVAEKDLLKGVFGREIELISDISYIEELIEKRKLQLAVTRLSGLLNIIQRKSKYIARRLVGAFCLQLLENESILQTLYCFTDSPWYDEALRIVALHYENDSSELAWRHWNIYISHCESQETSLSDMAKALIYRRLARILVSCPIEMLFEDLPFFDEHPESAPAGRRTADEHFRASLDCCALSLTYRHYFHYWRFCEEYEKQAIIVAQEWHDNFPKVVEPLIYLAETYVNRKAYRKCLKYLEKIEKVDPLNEKARALKTRALLGSLIRRIQKGAWALAPADLDELEQVSQMQAKDLRSYLIELRNVVAFAQTGTVPFKPWESEDLPVHERRFRQFLHNSVFNLSLWKISRLKKGVFPLEETIPVDDVMEYVVRVLFLSSEIRQDTNIRSDWMIRIEAKMAELPDLNPDFLLKLCAATRNYSFYSILFFATTIGLQTETQMTGYFLYYRGEILEQSYGQDARECFLAAIVLARRNRQTDLLEKANGKLKRTRYSRSFPFSFREPDIERDLPCDEEINDIIDFEKDRNFPRGTDMFGKKYAVTRIFNNALKLMIARAEESEMERCQPEPEAEPSKPEPEPNHFQHGLFDDDFDD